MQIRDKIIHIESIIDFQLGKFDKKSKELTSNIIYLRNNDRTFTEWCRVADMRLESISNTCDRIERKCQVKNDKLENHIDEKLIILNEHLLEIVDNTKRFATHLARSDSESQKLKNEINAHVDQIHKNYEPNLHIPRHSTPFNKENLLVKETLTPFLRENLISERDIPKLEEWTKFSGEGEYCHIELIIVIYMLKERFNIPNEMIFWRLNSFFTQTSMKWYHKLRQECGKHDWLLWKYERITKWANNSWRFIMENDF
ncbi:hypothetical protein O181_060970 [Austropuccinia psidii MF-1]|uniref:Uncharacterized protein n=1 Tax=Austropuccinia psidii MF-1 TaxID=1389203 RepID=A0A9Q3ELG5_9BASI|nr:hypothetical protein [Austropuccinia psidii MF-1]